MVVTQLEYLIVNVQTILVLAHVHQVSLETNVTCVIPIIMVLQQQVAQPVLALLEELPCVTLSLVLVHAMLDTLELPVILVILDTMMILPLMLANVRIS